MSTIIIPGDTSAVRGAVGALVVEFGSLRKVSDLIAHVSIGHLSLIMREKVAPTPALLDYLEFDRIYRVEYKKR